jgi:hypothetical protein
VYLVLKIRVSIIIRVTLTPNINIYLCRFIYIVIVVEYRLLFGMSKLIPGFPYDPDQSVVNKNFCFFIVPCLCRRFGWFIFAKLDRKIYTPNILRYTQKNAETIVQPYFNFLITKHVLF